MAPKNSRQTAFRYPSGAAPRPPGLGGLVPQEVLLKDPGVLLKDPRVLLKNPGVLLKGEIDGMGIATSFKINLLQREGLSTLWMWSRLDALMTASRFFS